MPKIGSVDTDIQQHRIYFLSKCRIVFDIAEIDTNESIKGTARGLVLRASCFVHFYNCCH